MNPKRLASEEYVPMLWFTALESEQPVPVRWVQSGTGPGFWAAFAGSADTIGTWYQKPTAHVITFYPGGASPTVKHHKVRIKVEVDQVTIDLFGTTRWSHTFVAGRHQASLLHEGGRVMPVVVHNIRQRVQVTPDGGYIQLTFTLADGDDIFAISLQVSFGHIERLQMEADHFTSIQEVKNMDMMERLEIQQDGPRLIIDARNAIRTGHHPRHQILTLIQDAPVGTLCEVHVPHRTGPLIAALEGLGLNVAVSEVEPGHWRLRLIKI